MKDDARDIEKKMSLVFIMNYNANFFLTENKI